MNRKGISLALNTVGIAILVIVVVMVLGFIFLGYVTKFVGIEDKCGEGVYAEYSCSDGRPEGNAFAHCFATPADRCDAGFDEDGDDTTQTVCCRNG